MIKQNSIGNILVLIVGTVLLVYTGARSVHVVQSTLPADSQVVGYAALAGLDGALIAWTIFRIKSARGDKQMAISLLMICLQLVGVVLLTLGDTLLVADPAGSPPAIRMIVLWAVPIIIGANVAASIAVHLTDPSNAVAQARRGFEDELQRQVAEHLTSRAPEISAGVAPAAAERRAAELLAELVGGGGQARPPASDDDRPVTMGELRQLLVELRATTVPAAGGPNGHAAEPVEVQRPKSPRGRGSSGTT